MFSQGASDFLGWCPPPKRFSSAWPGISDPPLSPCSGDVSQMGVLISLDCLLHQMKAERIVDVYGVTLQLARSCCLMTPTLVGGTDKESWAGQSRTFMLSSLELAACCPLPGCHLPPGSPSSLCRDLFHASSPPCGSASCQGLRALSSPSPRFWG